MRTSTLAFALAFTLAAGRAPAAIMLADLEGGWNAPMDWESFRIEIRYNTGLAREAPYTDPLGGLGRALTWNEAMHQPSPIVSLAGALIAWPDDSAHPDAPDQPVPSFYFSFDAPTAFEIVQSENAIQYTVRQGDLGFSLGTTHGACLNCADADVTRFDRPFVWRPRDYGTLNVGQPSQALAMAETIALRRAVPEPDVWALLILGVMGVGGMLRLQRKASGTGTRIAFRAARASQPV